MFTFTAAFSVWLLLPSRFSAAGMRRWKKGRRRWPLPRSFRTRVRSVLQLRRFPSPTHSTEIWAGRSSMESLQSTRPPRLLCWRPGLPADRRCCPPPRGTGTARRRARHVPHPNRPDRDARDASAGSRSPRRPGSGPRAESERTARREWWRALAFLALGLFVAEWLVYHRAAVARLWAGVRRR